MSLTIGNIPFKNFNVISFKGNTNYESKKYMANNQQPSMDVVSFKGRNLEPIQDLASKSGELTEYYKKAQAITNFIHQQSKKYFDRASDFTKEGINPFYDRIPFDGAMGLKMYYGSPSSLLTPLGKMQINGSTVYNPNQQKELMALLTEKLGLVEILPEVFDTMGVHGPIYAITKDLQGKPLPKLSTESLTQKFMGNYSGSDSYEEATGLISRVVPKRK